jgi:putative ABC transport system permease protein
MLRAEALLIAAIGGALGTAVAIAGLVPLSVATAGSPLPSGPIWIFPAVLALATGLVLVPTIAVTRMTLRHRAAAEVERP